MDYKLDPVDTQAWEFIFIWRLNKFQVWCKSFNATHFFKSFVTFKKSITDKDLLVAFGLLGILVK